MVHTDKGVLPIHKLAGHTVNALSQDGVYRAAKFDSYGEQALYKVTLPNGEQFFATGDHQWVTVQPDADRKVPTTKLAGKTIPFNPAPRPEEDSSYFEGFAHGIVYGDGSSDGYSTKVFLFGTKQELVDIVEPFSRNGRIQHEGHIYVGTLPAHWKNLPTEEVSRSYWRGFINGLIATDGTVTRGSICLDQSNSEALAAIRTGAMWAGYVPTEIKMTRTHSPYTGEYAPSFRLAFRGWSVSQEDLVRSNQKAVFNPRQVARRTTKVISVEPTGRVEEVFCAVEPETHTITVGSGILTGQCHVSHWNEEITDHFDFTFMRLMEGGGVGTNYSSKYINRYDAPKRELRVHIVCDPSHPDYTKMIDAGVLSKDFSHEWAGAFQIGDSREGWSEAMCDLINTYYIDDVKHYDRVYNITGVREEGRPLVSFGGTASGPLPLAIMLHEISEIVNKRSALGEKLNPIDMMEIDHSLAMCVVSGGNRRSARMAMVAWDDPFIMEFINCKADSGKHWTTNISVAIDTKFIDYLHSNSSPESESDIEDRNNARTVYESAINGMLTNGEPGFWNYSLANHGELAEVVCTNPCGEIGLREWEACILGHVNMDAFAPTPTRSAIDYEGMFKAHRLMTRFLIRASFGDKADPKQNDMVNRNRRIGVGHFGVAGFLNKLGIKYSEAPQQEFYPELLRDLYQAVKSESTDYAFKLRIAAPVANTTMAPTGSIAKLVGATEGAQPPYAKYYFRRIQFSTINATDQIQRHIDEGYDVEDSVYSANTKVIKYVVKEKLVQEVEDLGLNADEIVESQDELTLEQMLSFQEMYQSNYVDNAISYTANIPEGKYSVHELADIIKPFLPKLKGTTIMVDGTRPQSPYERITKMHYNYLSGPKSVEDSVDEECSTGACPIR
jgi:adenosylcobalamin-dependent ribonucleoside-triphosphate reductase